MTEDTPAFCEHLNLPLIELPEWYKEFRIPIQGPSPPPHSTGFLHQKKKSKFINRTGPSYGKSPYAAKGSRSQNTT